MDSKSTQNQIILRELVTQWQQATTDKPKIFEKILKRIDTLIIHRIKRLKRNKRFARLNDQDIENDEIYNTAIVGVYRGLESVAPTDPGRRAQARILSYITEEIRKTFIPHKTEIITSTIDKNDDCLMTKEPEFLGIEFEELKDIVNKLINNFTLPNEDWKIFVKHHVDGKTYGQISSDLGVHKSTVANRIRNVKKILKEAMEGKSVQ